MNQKLCKALRIIAFNNTPSVIERKNRKWAIYEDKKHHIILRCLDPRAQYLAMKRIYKDLKSFYRIIYQLEAKNEARNIKAKFPRGVEQIPGRTTFLGNVINLQENGPGVR